jgi:hypothetical protein
MLKILIVTTILLSTFEACAEHDKSQILNGVELTSKKSEAVRSYSGRIEKVLPFPILLVKKGITNFSERCNSAYSEKRKFMAKNVECKYHNENIVETQVIDKINPREELKKYSESYILAKQIYNRGSYGYYELVTISEIKESDDKKRISIVQKMLDDEEVKIYTSPKFTRESAFDTSIVIFTLTEISSSKTLVEYEFFANTDHWVLNKEVAVPQVFASISKNVTDLMTNIEQESDYQMRAIASEQAP